MRSLHLLLGLLLFAIAFSSTDASIIWTNSINNCTCDKIDSMFSGKFTIKGERCSPDASCTRPMDRNYMVVYFPDNYHPPNGSPSKMGLALLKDRHAGWSDKSLNVTAAFDLICVGNTWYAQKFPYEISYTDNDTMTQTYMEPTELNKLRLKHEIRLVMCGG